VAAKNIGLCASSASSFIAWPIGNPIPQPGSISADQFCLHGGRFYLIIAAYQTRAHNEEHKKEQQQPGYP